MKIFEIPKERKAIRQKVKEPFITKIYGVKGSKNMLHFNSIYSTIFPLPFLKVNPTVVAAKSTNNLPVHI